MENTNPVNISLCQMRVVPGRPDINAAYIIEEIAAAKERGVDMIIFPEMCLTGYIVGDIFEDDFFIEDVLGFNKNIIEATKNGIAAIFGTIIISSKTGEDGRQRKHNAAILAQGGKIICQTIKSLQPNYRFFNDDKHFYSLRKVASEQTQKEGEKGKEIPENKGIRNLLSPALIQTKLGPVSVGITVCEDIWHENYPFNPAEILAEKGAKIIVNISASPWTWQKNRRRHQIIQNLIALAKIPLIYVNNTGCQNTGKNIIVFDGSSAVYNADGKIVFEAPPYAAGSYDFTLCQDQKPLEEKTKDDTEELYLAMLCAVKSIVPPDKKVIVGLSGGIDSAVVCSHLADALGPERVLAINMPFSPFSSQETRDIALALAKNLGVAYEVAPIDGLVEVIARASDVEPDTLAYENIQSRARKEILAAKAQKINGVFVCCSNKTEIAFGYGTLYGDIAGFYAPLGDLIKREVRQIADYLNRVRFKKEIIPEKCIKQTPTAELAKGQKDPFDYGNVNRRGYHDEMIRAFTEFRKNPEWFIELYIKGKLESELKLETGTLSALFPAPNDFVNDLRYWWTKFQQSFFKRVQCPPIPIFSPRAFGRDLEESLMSPHFTQRYWYLEKLLLKREKYRSAKKP